MKALFVHVFALDVFLQFLKFLKMAYKRYTELKECKIRLFWGVVHLSCVHINPHKILSECAVHDLICPGICTTDPLTESLLLTFMNLDYAWTECCHFIKIFSILLLEKQCIIS